MSDVSTEISKAARALADGHLVALPTETVYGLAADATNPEAVARIYLVKGRPSDHPLIVHISNPELLEHWAIQIPSYARLLANNFWPGPMTLVLKRSELAKDFITGSQDTVALRIPGHSTALEILAGFEAQGGLGVAAPSANRFGKVSPTTAQAVAAELSAYLTEQDVIVDGGESKVGLESTIIDCTGDNPRVLRPGAVTVEMIEQATGLAVVDAGANIRVSGSLKSHYAPAAKVVLDAAPKPGDGLIAMSDLPTPAGVIRLAAPDTLEAYAKELYAALRAADEQKLTRVVALTPHGAGLAIAIRDRLSRAAS
jgi:L-threonylcarbamoyladenylate synthase